MKNSIFGYDSKDVDEALAALNKQNATLLQRNRFMEEELNNLKLQLDEARSALAEGMTKADMDNYRELRKAYAALRENVENSGPAGELKEELAAVKAELQDVKEENASLKAQLEKNSTRPNDGKDPDARLSRLEDRVNSIYELLNSMRENA